MSLLKWFVKINYHICNKIESFLPIAKPDITNLYEMTVAKYANSQPKQVIVDVGGGRYTPFAKNLIPKLKHKLIIIDSSKEELDKNINADQKTISDINKKLPLAQSSTNLIVSRYTLEHLENLSDFICNSHQVLKKGGYFIHLFSCKFALFAIFNQLLPNNIAHAFLIRLIPGSKNIRGFKTNYRDCYYDEIIKILSENGFQVETVIISYYQSRYFRFFVPFYVISIIYEIILQMFGLKNLCAYLLIIAKKV